MQTTAPDAAVTRKSVAGVDLEVWSGGSGRPLLLLHPGDGLDYQLPFLEHLARRYRVVAPSHPGFGGSSLPDTMNSVDDLAFFYLDFMEAEDLRDAVVLGISFGGWIAAEIAVRCQERIAGLVLADAVGAKFEGPMVREIADLFATPIYDQSAQIYADPARQKPDFSERSDEALTRLARNHESFAVFAWSPTLHSPKLRQRLHRIKVPTLLLWGAEDRVVPPAYGRRFAAAIPGAGFELIEAAGHYPQVEQPEKFVAAVARFVDRLPVADRRVAAPA